MRTREHDERLSSIVYIRNARVCLLELTSLRLAVLFCCCYLIFVRVVLFLYYGYCCHTTGIAMSKEYSIRIDDELFATEC